MISKLQPAWSIRAFDHYSKSDRLQLRKMLQTSWRETYLDELGAGLVTTLIDTLSSHDLADIVPGKDEKILLAIHNETIIGSTASGSRDGTTYIWACYILKKFQKLGIGRELVTRSLALHDPSNQAMIYVLQTSKSAISFYHAMGFTKIGEDHYAILPDHSLVTDVMAGEASLIGS